MIGQKDPASVEASGKRLMNYIDGVIVRDALTQFDERGELCEIYDPRWQVIREPVVYVYSSVVRPGRIKGWVYHKLQTDRLFFQSGFSKVVLFDLRPDSRTKGLINEIHATERNRGLIVIPPYVAHAVENVGTVDATFINMPTRPYDHADPDKFRVDRNDIPYEFDKGRGW